MATRKRKSAMELVLAGEIETWQKDVLEAIISLSPGEECVLYIDSAGGSSYAALSVVTLLRHRKVQATGVALAECSSSTLWIFAACQTRFATPLSTFLFHPLHAQTEKTMGTQASLSWAKHFKEQEESMDRLLPILFGCGDKEIREWNGEERIVTAKEMVAAGLAQMLDVFAP